MLKDLVKVLEKSAVYFVCALYYDIALLRKDGSFLRCQSIYYGRILLAIVATYKLCRTD